MTSPWKDYRLDLDSIVDGFWAEPIEIHPMIAGDVSDDATADPSRPIMRGVAVYMRPGAAITGEGGTQGAMLTTQIVQSDVWASITIEQVGGGYIPVYNKDDRIFWPERNEWYAISYVVPSATGRPNIHMIHLSSESINDYLTVEDASVGHPVLGSPELVSN